jgi:hypothetical protein
MKKSVVIIIGVIYGLSIVVVTLFGLKHKTFNEIIYVSQITIEEENIRYLPSGDKFIILKPDENGNCQYQLKWTVSPDNVTTPGVTFDYDRENPHVTVDENGLVTFTGQTEIKITISSTDGTPAKDTIRIYCYNSDMNK